MSYLCRPNCQNCSCIRLSNRYFCRISQKVIIFRFPYTCHWNLTYFISKEECWRSVKSKASLWLFIFLLILLPCYESFSFLCPCLFFHLFVYFGYVLYPKVNHFPSLFFRLKTFLNLSSQSWKKNLFPLEICWSMLCRRRFRRQFTIQLRMCLCCTGLNKVALKDDSPRSAKLW